VVKRNSEWNGGLVGKPVSEREHDIVEGRLIASLTSYFRFHGVNPESYTQMAMTVIDSYIESSQRLQVIQQENIPVADSTPSASSNITEGQPVLAGLANGGDEF
jgi:hypothetical protein